MHHCRCRKTQPACQAQARPKLGKPQPKPGIRLHHRHTRSRPPLTGYTKAYAQNQEAWCILLMSIPILDFQCIASFSFHHDSLRLWLRRSFFTYYRSPWTTYFRVYKLQNNLLVGGTYSITWKWWEDKSCRSTGKAQPTDLLYYCKECSVRHSLIYFDRR